MPQARSPKLPITLGFLCITCGCGLEPDTIESITEIANRSAGSGLAGEISNLSDPFSNAADAAADQYAADGSGSTSGAHSFEPPYPNRDNPFVYPTEMDSTTTGPTSTSVAEIQVMGFANTHSNPDSGRPVVESKVLLKTNVGIKSLAVGEQVGKITVLRIDSPTVELKMGSLIWTATMFDR